MKRPVEKEESVIMFLHKHLASYSRDILKAAALVVAAVFLLMYAATIPSSILHVCIVFTFPFLLLFAWIRIMIVWVNYSLSMFVLTDEHVYYLRQDGLFGRSARAWKIKDIDNVASMSGSFLESYFQFGSIDLFVKGERVVIRGLPNADYVCSIILKQEEQRDSLVMSAKHQKELLAFVSHEVKGHLTKNRAMFAAILEGDFGPVSPTLSEMAHAALSDTDQGVNTVLSILRAPDGSEDQIEMQMRPFDISASVLNVTDSLRGEIAEKGLELRMQIEPRCVIVGDEAKVSHMIIRNLVDNALRYTPTGSLSVSLKSIDGTVRLVVSDTGVGIDAKDMKKLFTEGGHGRNSKQINSESTGYGLYIARQITESLGGKISAKSDGVGKGAIFMVEFPVYREHL